MRKVVIIGAGPAGLTAAYTMLKRSKEAWNEDYIPSFEELDDDLHVICHWEDEFWYEYDSPIKKSAFILPYKDWYFDFSIYGQDWQWLYIYYRLKKIM